MLVLVNDCDVVHLVANFLNVVAVIVAVCVSVVKGCSVVVMVSIIMVDGLSFEVDLLV